VKTGCGDFTARRCTEYVKLFMFWSFCMVLGRFVNFAFCIQRLCDLAIAVTEVQSSDPGQRHPDVYCDFSRPMHHTISLDAV